MQSRHVSLSPIKQKLIKSKTNHRKRNPTSSRRLNRIQSKQKPKLGPLSPAIVI